MIARLSDVQAGRGVDGAAAKEAERGVVALDTGLCPQPALPPRDVIRHPGHGELMALTRGTPHPRRGPGS